MFIAVDGIDGAGKTTLVERLASFLRQRNIDIVVTKEPTGESHWGKELRRAAQEGRLSKNQEVAYFHKDRLHHIEQVIRPAIDQNKVVITDRYVDSTLAYQTNNPTEARKLYAQFLKDGVLIPDITFILKCPVELGLIRISKRGNGDKSTFETTETLEKARTIFESRHGKHYVFLDASKNADEIFDKALVVLSKKFPFLLRPVIDRNGADTEGISPLAIKRKAVG